MVKDAHESGRNIDGSELPVPVELISGWSGHPLHMVQEISDEFDAAVFIGYHAPASSAGNPLAHTLASKKVASLRLNGALASEYLICAHAAEMFGVPVVFASGDEALCAHVAAHSPGCRTVATMRGAGPSVIARHPDAPVAEIRRGVEEALGGDVQASRLPRYEEYRLEIAFTDKRTAYRGARDLVHPVLRAGRAGWLFAATHGHSWTPGLAVFVRPGGMGRSVIARSRVVVSIRGSECSPWNRSRKQSWLVRFVRPSTWRGSRRRIFASVSFNCSRPSRCGRAAIKGWWTTSCASVTSWSCPRTGMGCSAASRWNTCSRISSGRWSPRCGIGRWSTGR